jgi:hypothetical protein
MNKTDTRYPYTYSADFIRSIAGMNFTDDGRLQGTKLSRSDASQIVNAIGDALGIDHKIMAEKIADLAILKKASEK